MDGKTTRVARCQHCGRSIMAVSIAYIEDEDTEQLEEYQKQGYEIVDIEPSALFMPKEGCEKCPPSKKKVPAQGSLI